MRQTEASIGTDHLSKQENMNMKKIMFLLAVAAVGLLFAGCVSVEAVQKPNLNGEDISASGTPVAHLNAQNWGFYLFSLPLLTGSTEAVGSIAVLQDTVNVESMVPVVTAKSKELKARRTLDLASQFSITGFIIYTRSINVSANAVK